MSPADRLGHRSVLSDRMDRVAAAVEAVPLCCSCRRHWRQKTNLVGASATCRQGRRQLHASMKIVRFAADELLVGQRADLFGLDQDNVLRVLDRSLDDEKRLFGNQQPHSLE